MQDEGFFDIEQFFQALAIPEAEQDEVVDCLVRGVAAYYRHIYGYDKYGEYPADMVEERMYEPYIFGFGAVEVVRRSSLSLPTQLKIALYTLQNTYPAEEYGTPHGLPVLLSFLARTDALKVPVFRLAMQTANIDGRDLFKYWQKDEVYDLINWLLESNMQPSELVWWMQHFLNQCNQPQLGKPLMEHLLDHPALSVECKRDFCQALLSETTVGKPPAQWIAMEAMLQGNTAELKAALLELSPEEQELIKFDPQVFEQLKEQEIDEFESPDFSFGIMFDAGYLRMISPYLKRRAILGLAQLGEDPLTLCKNYLGAAAGSYYEDAINQGVADIIREYHQTMPEDSIRRLVEKGLKKGKSTTTRKSFYQLGADIFGARYWTRAQKDNAKSIRDWATKKVAGQTQTKSKLKRKVEVSH